MDRRAFLALTGPAFAARLLCPPVRFAGGPRGPSVRPGRVAEIGMRSDPAGARVWFEPRGIAIRCGDVVRWTLREGVHSATSYHPDNERPLRIPEDAAPWDSGILMEPGATFEVVLDTEGVYDFFCRPHEAAGMVGRVVVLPASGAVPRVLNEPRYPIESSGGRLPPASVGAFPSVREILATLPGGR